MKPTDFIQFFDFSNHATGRGNALDQNQCSILLNKKNATYYFRFGTFYSDFTHLNIGQSNGSIFFLLNKKNGLSSSKNKGMTTVAFVSREAVTSVLSIIKPSYSKTKESLRIDFETVSSSESEILLRLKDIIS